MNLQEIKSKLAGNKHRVAQDLVKQIVRQTASTEPTKVAAELGFKPATMQKWLKDYGEFRHFDHAVVTELRTYSESKRKSGAERINYSPTFKKKFIDTARELKLPINKMSRIVGVEASTAYAWIRGGEKAEKETPVKETPVKETPVKAKAAQTVKTKTITKAADHRMLVGAATSPKVKRVAITVPVGTQITLPSGHSLDAQDYALIRDC